LRYIEGGKTQLMGGFRLKAEQQRAEEGIEHAAL
jgi:hypothetical protein